MFRSALSFDQNIGDWNVSSVTDMTEMFLDATLSTNNYDALLTGWDSQILKTGVDFHGGSSTYCLGDSARTNMINTDEWNIYDGGQSCPPVDIQLSSTIIDENTITGTQIAIINTVDIDTGDTYTYILTGGIGSEDNGKFTIASSGLILNFMPDYENPIDSGDTAGNNTYSVRIQTDDGTHTYQKSFIITIMDVVESCSLPRGGTIANGSSTTAYQSNSVSCGSTCISETRTCTNGVLGGTYNSQSCSIASCGGGGGGGSMSKDSCPDGDNSPSYYDGSCREDGSNGDNDGNNNDGEINDKTNCSFEDQFKNAHCFARQFGITTIDDYEKANPEGHLLRKHLAKMMVNFSLNILGNTTPDGIPENCKQYTDISDISTEVKAYIEIACSMGVMGVNSNGKSQEIFNPDKMVSRAEFGTVLSRVLRGSKYNTSRGNRREKHLQALKINNYMTRIDGSRPDYLEIRKYVWLMLQRVGEKN